MKKLNLIQDNLLLGLCPSWGVRKLREVIKLVTIFILYYIYYF